MAEQTNIIVFGTGSFAGRIVFDIAATARDPVSITVAGRNLERLDWLKTAGNARAVIFERPATFQSRTVDLSDSDGAADLIAELQPSAVVQAASPQPSAIIAAKGNAWSQLIAEAGLSAMAVTQTMFSVRVARAVKAACPDCHFINGAYPDVGNTIIAAQGLPVTCGVGNVSILASVFAAALGAREPGRLKVLAHYQTITPFRHTPETRKGRPPRVWLDDEEIADVHGTLRDVKLTAAPAIDVSGAAGVPMMLALVSGRAWQGHAPGPHGLPGGYPVSCRDGRLDLALPPALDREEAVRWNRKFEEANGLFIDADGRAHYTGVLQEKLHALSPVLAQGFDVGDFDQVFDSFETLRTRLLEQPEL
ncbi:MAG: hypothetical protein ACR2PM_09020 [Hyphomicrobiales bacterium]